jgi:hypothetical protein
LILRNDLLRPHRNPISPLPSSAMRFGATPGFQILASGFFLSITRTIAGS